MKIKTKLTKLGRNPFNNKGFVNPPIFKGSTILFKDFKSYIQDRDKKVVMTCSIGACAAIGGKLLKDMGFKNVALLEGGVEAWKKSGLDIEQH